MPPPITVFVGTKAEYIKTAPLMRLFQDRGVPFRLIDSGQHGEYAKELRRALEVKEPDLHLSAGGDVSTIPHALRWSLRLAARLVQSPTRLRNTLFDGRTGVCVVHGDTPTTLLATLLARRAGLKVAHLESGLRSHRLTHPFPEEIIRILVMRRADFLFAPDETAAENLRRMKVKGRIVLLPGNTVIDAVAHAGARAGATQGPVIATMHRVENLQGRARLDRWVDLLLRISEGRPVEFAMHEPTRIALAKTGGIDRLRAGGVTVTELQPYAEFVAKVAAAPFVVTDGGSVQEEATFLGVPALLWRDRTERTEGLGTNVVVSRYDQAVIDEFLADPARHRYPPQPMTTSPSQVAFDVLRSLEE